MRKTVRKNKSNNNNHNKRATRKKTVGGSISSTATVYDPRTLANEGNSPLFSENSV